MPTLSASRWLGFLLACAPVLASAVTLDFEDGTGEGPTSLGVYDKPGVTISNGFVFLDADTDQPGRPGTGNFGNAPSKYGALTLYRDALTDDKLSISFAGGITQKISFWYSTIDHAATVTVLDAGNNVLAESGASHPALLELGSNDVPFKGPFSDAEEGSYNRWRLYTLTFDGVGQTVTFSGFTSNPGPTGKVFGDFFIDNLTVTAAVPETSTVVMMLAGLAGVGAVARRRRG